MKFLSVLILSFVAQITVAQNCTNPVNHNIFQSKYTQVANMGNDQQKLNISSPFVSNNCVSSNQISMMSGLFISDTYRLEFCKMAYAKCTDKSNFYDVYDAFATFSYALRLHDYVRDQEAGKPTIDPTTKPVTFKPHTFPSYNYPSSVNYLGNVGCSKPVSDEDFKVIVDNVIKQPTEESKMVAANNMAGTNCINMEQAMKTASLFKTESNRLQFLQNNFWSFYDLDNYPYANILFTQTNLSNAWISYCDQALNPVIVEEPAAPTSCELTDDKAKEMAKRLDKAAFGSDQMNLVNTFEKDHCFTVAQIGFLMEEFSFPNDKLACAKKLYPKCTNQNEFYKLTDRLSFNRDKDTLLDFIRKQK